VYDTVAAEQILFGADYPHGRGGRDDQFYPMTLKENEEVDIPKVDKEKIYYLNAKKLFKYLRVFKRSSVQIVQDVSALDRSGLLSLFDYRKDFDMKVCGKGRSAESSEAV